MCLLSFRKRVDSDGIRVEKFNRFINGIRIRKRYYELRILTKWRRFLKFIRNRRNPPRETRVSLRILGHVYFSFFFILHDHRTKSLSKALYFYLVLLLIEEEEEGKGGGEGEEEKYSPSGTAWLVIKKLTQAAPVPCPINVTFLGSPPKLPMFSCTQWSAAI